MKNELEFLVLILLKKHSLLYCVCVFKILKKYFGFIMLLLINYCHHLNQSNNLKFIRIKLSKLKKNFLLNTT